MQPTSTPPPSRSSTPDDSSVPTWREVVAVLDEMILDDPEFVIVPVALFDAYEAGLRRDQLFRKPSIPLTNLLFRGTPIVRGES